MTQPRRPQRRTPEAEAYTRAVAEVRRRLVAYSAAAYSAVGVDDPGLEALVGRMVPAVEAAQIRVANLTAVHLAREAGTEAVDVDEALVTQGRGIDPATVYQRPIIAARAALSEQMPFVEAKAAGQRRLEQLVTTDVQMAKIRQADRSLRAAGRQFYRRVPKGESTCALCLIAATQRYKVGNLLPIHPGCDCGVEEIPAGLDLDDLLDTDALLESTHAKVEAFTSIADRGGRAVDYRKLLITHEHGEIGPLIAWDGQKFTGSSETGTKVSISGRDTTKPAYDRPDGEDRRSNEAGQQTGMTPPEPPRSGSSGATGDFTDDEWDAHVEYVKEALDSAPTTDELYKDDLGLDWTPERTRQQQELMDAFWADNDVDNVPRDGRAIVSGGIAGAGKTTVLKGAAGIDTDQYVTINPDDIKQAMAERGMIPEVDGLSPMEASTKAHEEASEMAKILAARAYALGTNVIWDITMSSENSVRTRVADLRAAGYTEVDAVFVDIPVDVSKNRAMSRWRGGEERFRAGNPGEYGGRYVPEDFVEASRPTDPRFNSRNRQVFEQVKAIFDSAVVYDNSGTDAVQGPTTGPRWE